MVIEEAAFLSLPVLTTETTSSEEMVTRNASGFVCENSQEAINEMLYKLLSDPTQLAAVKAQNISFDNCAALQQFEQMLQ